MAARVTLEDHEASLCLALTQAAHDAAEILSADVHGAVPHRLRGQVLHVARRLSGDNLLGRALLEDLTALAERLGPLVDAGTYVEWHFDENDVNGGHEALVYTRDAASLRQAIVRMRTVEAASHALATFERAMRIRAKLPVA